MNAWHTAPMGGFTRGDPMVSVFTGLLFLSGRSPR